MSQTSVSPPPQRKDEDHPWMELEQLLQGEDRQAVSEYLLSLGVEDQRRALSRLSADHQEETISLLPAEVAAEVISHLPEEQAADILEELAPEQAADIVEELPAKVSADLLQEMDTEDSEEILEEIENSEEAEDLRELARYDPESAGGLMVPDPISFPFDASIGTILREIGEKSELYSDRDVQYLYVTDKGGRLAGVLPLRNLVLSPRGRLAEEAMIPKPLSVQLDTSLDDLEDITDQKNYLALPVVDKQGTLRGIVTRSSIQEACADRQTDDYLASAGIIGGEELRSMPLFSRAIRRLTWLGPNIILNIIAASVIALNEDVLQSVIALAIFLPIVSDMSGCSGNQAVAVSIRELTLGILRPSEFIRVIWKEGLVGIINGIVLGIVLGSLATLYKGNIWLGLVIGSALALNTVLSVLLGGLVPLFLKKLKIDPALASAPILTTCTDMCGFFLVLNLAASVINKL